MAKTYPFEEVGRLPLEGDNVAIATKNLKDGTRILYKGIEFALDYTVMEGHRFAVHPITPGEPLLSWEIPFGIATQTIKPGTYVCNSQILDALRIRNLEFNLPIVPNFEDRIEPYKLDSKTFKPGIQVPSTVETRNFYGYRRSPSRGVGTRNVILILGTTSRTNGYVKQLEKRLKGLTHSFENIDSIVSVTHTEGGGRDRPNNLDLLLRTLAGFFIHPNVGALLVVNYGSEPLTNKMLHSYLKKMEYPLEDVLHRFLTLNRGFEEDLKEGEKTLKRWMKIVNQTGRTLEPASTLKIALQCGGSDAFSGISGNPLASWVTREILRQGGSANLAETDELIGAESYILKNARNRKVAQRFLDTIERYKKLVAWHGATAEGNPSGGNKLRGLYNIVLKSIGAAMKRHPDVCLDEIIDYGELMLQPGYYFMDSPGNDLESIAGQVASGANIIFFVTGNGSITNFPFVPTIKITTTTTRHTLLKKEMDVNAGAYLDGASMNDLGKQMMELTLEIASGRRSKGEQAGHAQVSIWRNWRQTDFSNLNQLSTTPIPTGSPIPIHTSQAIPTLHFTGIQKGKDYITDRIGLILPTSLCSGQIAQLGANRLNRKTLDSQQGISRYVALPHTEGCGVAGELTERIYSRTMLSYLTHPLVQHALVLEHGCEKTHNDYLRNKLEDIGIDPRTFGWASVQQDGGIDDVLQKIENWFDRRLSNDDPPTYGKADFSNLRLGVLATGSLSESAAKSLAKITQTVVGSGGTIVVPETGTLITSEIFWNKKMSVRPPTPSLAHGERVKTPGFHIMENPTDHWVETLTGLGGTGIELLLAYTGDHPQQGHPLIPMLQISDEDNTSPMFREDLDLSIGKDIEENVKKILKCIIKVASREYTPKPFLYGNTDFQFTRGLLGVSM